MPPAGKGSGGAKTARQLREKRLEAQLRANLKRRKEQAHSRVRGDDAGGTEADAGPLADNQSGAED
jgi:hypothetical protein